MRFERPQEVNEFEAEAILLAELGAEAVGEVVSIKATEPEAELLLQEAA